MTTQINHCKVQRFGNERQLVATKNIAEGETVLLETALLSIPIRDRYVWQTYSWELVAQLLSNAELLKQYQRLHLSTTPMLLDAMDKAIEGRLVTTFKRSHSLVQSLINGVGTNNVGVLNHDQCVVGYGIYEVLSFANHSCEPSTRLTAANAAQGQVSLVAVRDIAEGAAVTWCYFRESEFLGHDYITRNLGLVNVFRFVCCCERCKRERPANLAGEKNLLGYFDRLIKEDAKEALADPEMLRSILESSPMAMHSAALANSRRGS